MFGKGNDFAKKITYRIDGADPEQLIKQFRNDFNPRIAVTVDMIATGTDVKPIEVLIFLRDVRSELYFEQMKGRGVRTIEPTDLRAVTPDAEAKTRFILIDAVGVTESSEEHCRSRWIVIARSLSTSCSIRSPLAIGAKTRSSTLAARLAALDRRIDPRDARGPRQDFERPHARRPRQRA